MTQFRDPTIHSPASKNAARLPYVPPQISFTVIELEEALMGFCKTSGSGGMPTGCNLACSSPGS